MPDFKPTEDILSLSEFRNTLADCVARTGETHRPLILTQNGRASSVFISIADWEKICERLHKADIYEDIIAAEGEIERGETVSHEDAMRMVETELKKATRKPRSKKRTQRIEAA